MSYVVRTLPEAEEQFFNLELWWDTNRPEASSLQGLLAQAMGLLADNPRIGMRYPARDLGRVHRYQMKPSPYFLYYTIDDEQQVLEIVSVWSGAVKHGSRL